MSVEKMNGIKSANKMQNFIPPKPLETAVLFLVFNRLETTKKVFEQIRLAKPPKLYIASDGARAERQGEQDIVNIVRNYVLENIDWQCEVKTLFRDKNLGCGRAVSGAITWFFENEEMGIILEDDCLPNQSFFWFCEKMLNTYKDDSRISMIGGTNYFIDIENIMQNDYFFSKYYSIWGWATWKRSWEMYDFQIKSWHNEIQLDDLKNIICDKIALKYYEEIFNLISNNKIDTWDIQWFYTCLVNHTLCILPSKNFIENIGFDGTHTTNKATTNNFIKTNEFNKNINDIKINNIMIPNKYYDFRLYKEKVHKEMFKIKLRNILKKLYLLNIIKKIFK